MRSPRFRAGAALAAALALLGGCDSLDRTRRPPEYEVGKDAEPDPEAKGFFHSSRLSGAMSSEGRDIERSLGVK